MNPLGRGKSSAIMLLGQFRQAVQREGFVTPDGTLGIEVTGTLDETWFTTIASKCRERLAIDHSNPRDVIVVRTDIESQQGTIAM